MTAQKSFRKKISSLLATATVALLAISGIAIAPSVANAAPGTVADATLEWGVKESFRNYIYNVAPTVFQGKSTLLGETVAQPVEKGEFVWSAGTGTASDDGSAADVSFGDGVGAHFQSHPMDDGAGGQAYALDLQFTNPHVVVTSATTGELHMDVVGREFVDTVTVGEEYTLDDVLLADLVLPAPTVANGVVTWTDAAATLTVDGHQAFGTFYEAGDTLDPVTFSAPVTVTQAPPTPVKFSDMKAGDKFYKEISWMAAEGISTGVKQPNGTYKYEPKLNVTREAMAAFLYRTDPDAASYKAPTTSYFSDLKPGDKFYKEISWMYDEGISTGVKQPSGKPQYQPKAGVTREAMAAFMYRIDTTAKGAAPKTSPFSDVVVGQKFYKEIAWMSTSGLSTGIKQPSGKSTYAAKNKVTREAMAAFLYRAN